MKKSRYYFCAESAEFCRPLARIREWMKREGIQTRTVYPARMQTKQDYFYCAEFGEMGIVGEGCGQDCKKYDPRNGKNGRCRFSKNGYEPDLQNPIIITI
jgi:hypothetical protein